MNAAAFFAIASRLPVVRSRHYTAPPYHLGSVLENRLGLQVLRVAGKAAAHALRRRAVAADIRERVAVLDRDGVLAIENFLPAEEFARVCDEFARANRGLELRPYKNVAAAKLYRTQLAVEDAAAPCPAIRRHFQENEMLDRIAAAVLRRAIDKRPDIYLDTYQNRNEAGIDNDIENILHADLHTPTVKMFFYLSETNERNGAFVYARGSHRLTGARLLHEYDLSVREARLKAGRTVPEEFLERRAEYVRNVIKPADRERMRVEETQLCVAPNTLVIANNMGFHRRGEFTGDEPRRALLINYRKNEPLLW